LHLITNFTLTTKKIIQEFVRLKVDRITISLWAGTPETYVKTHPNQTETTFFKIFENLKYLQTIKKNDNLPKIRIYNVISSLNFYEIDKMIEFALNSRSNYVEFQVADIVEGKTDQLSLTPQMGQIIVDQLENLKSQDLFIKIPAHKRLDGFKESMHKDEFTEFSRIINKNSYLPYFRYVLEDLDNLNVFCRKNIGTEYPEHGAIKAEEDNKIENAYKFYFDNKHCTAEMCRFANECLIDKKRYLIKTDVLTLLGIGSFIRRIKNIAENKKSVYDSNIVDTMPCYVGWTYTRILPNGDVLPCCKAHKKPLGNICEKSLREIWFSVKYNEFRKMAKLEKKNHPYFEKINCYKSCDNVGMNLETHLQMSKNETK
jgi:MoaA/NifB/PqqE/SkfB family radical SAM enzyme